jgi:hypothetical protein
VTIAGWAAVVLAGLALGWLAALLAALARLQAAVTELRSRLAAAEVGLVCRLCGAAVERPSGGTGGERPLSEGEIEPPP